jgi:hypothetical protein
MPTSRELRKKHAAAVLKHADATAKSQANKFNQRVEARVNHLIQSGVYAPTNIGFDTSNKRLHGFRPTVRKWVKQYMEEYDRAEIHRSPTSLKNLMQVKGRSRISLQKTMPEIYEDHKEQEWKVIETTGKPVIVQDEHGEILFLKLPIDSKLIDKLEETDAYVNARRKLLIKLHILL